ncbi:MAG: TrmH family RNA methyltransferase [Candidatus Algichlamydia australiensis]|nr:TrmH family RNA methyltransferase [Chlamydiales bacterium]
MNFSERKFLALPERKQHKLALENLRNLVDNQPNFYRNIEKLLKLPPANTHEEFANRHHEHAEKAKISLAEHNLLIRKGDRPSNTPFGPIGIYLDDLRSAHNVGSILRTTEAFRLGSVYFSEKTPYIDNKKVQDAAMGTSHIVPCSRDLETMPHPLIALETVKGAPSVFDFDFPESFTLVLGNEEYGVSEKMLKKCTIAVQIPLLGSKNSLNVANAFAITGGQIAYGKPFTKQLA